MFMLINFEKKGTCRKGELPNCLLDDYPKYKKLEGDLFLQAYFNDNCGIFIVFPATDRCLSHCTEIFFDTKIIVGSQQTE